MTADDTTRVDAPRHTDDTPDARLAQIRERNRRLAAVPFETHGGGHGPGCIPCELVRAIGDVSWLLEQSKRLNDKAAEDTRTVGGFLARASHAELRLNAALKELAALRAERTEFVELLGWHVDAEDDPCRLDHHGHCQAHGSLEDGPCRTAASRELLARIRAAQQPEDGDRG